MLKLIASDQLPLSIVDSQTFRNYVDWWPKICHSKAFYHHTFTYANMYSTNGRRYAIWTCMFVKSFPNNRSLDKPKHGKFLGHHYSLHRYKMETSHLCPDNRPIFR